MKRLTASDAMFLYGESREVMMHVAGLLPFTPAPGQSPDHLRELVDEMRVAGAATVQRPWNLKLRFPDLPKNPLQSWVETEVDLEYHVRRSALPSPGDERELGILVSRLHGGAVDFHRPPWEVHLIEGLEGGRFALYVKVHHALVDGFTAMRILSNALSPDPEERRPLFFAIPQPRREKPPMTPLPADAAAAAHDHEALDLADLVAAVRAQYSASKTVVRALRNVISRDDHALISPSQAPLCVLNARISRSRRFATQLLPYARLREIAKRAGGTLNDVVLALSASCLRRYLQEQDALPTEPLIAMVPVAVRAKDEEGGGNAVGAILATLATDLADPAERLHRIIESTTKAKAQLAGMSKAAILQYSALLISPSILQVIPGVAGRVRPTYNVIISNVPGPEQPLYFRGARLEASYPMSVPVHGQALNITCNSYAGQICFGFTGCRDTVPHLQRLAVYCGDALSELAGAVS